MEERYELDDNGDKGDRLLLTEEEWLAHMKNCNSTSTKKSTFDKAKVHCYNCQEYRHYAKECRTPKKEEAHFVMTDADDESTLL